MRRLRSYTRYLEILPLVRGRRLEVGAADDIVRRRSHRGRKLNDIYSVTEGATCGLIAPRELKGAAPYGYPLRGTHSLEPEARRHAAKILFAAGGGSWYLTRELGVQVVYTGSHAYVLQGLPHTTKPIRVLGHKKPENVKRFIFEGYASTWDETRSDLRTSQGATPCGALSAFNSRYYSVITRPEGDYADTCADVRARVLGCDTNV